MRVQLRLFAIASQLADKNVIDLELPETPTVAELRNELVARVAQLQPMAAQLRFAVNTDYAADDTPIREGDELACIPPVSGG